MGRMKKWLAGAMSLCMMGSTMAALPTESAAAADYSMNSGNINVEYLDRGISAVNTGSGMLVSWRFLANDADDATFVLYRDGAEIYRSTSGKATCYLDASGSASSKYRVDTLSASGAVLSTANCNIITNSNHFDVQLDRPGSQYTPNDCSVGDVDGDGVYEIFVKWDPSNSQDNSKKGKTDPCIIDCYRLDGTKLWRVNIGVNVRSGAHYTQFFVADFDLDGKAEMTCKTGDGTKDGQGNIIGDASKVWRDSSGLIYSGPEYYTLFDGETGKALDTIDYKPGRGDPTKWGKSSDKYNRVERYWGVVAYLDGVSPSVVTGRGYYGRMTATAYTVKNDKLVELWAFDTGTSSSTPGYGDGNHNSMAADVDGDGKQEVITGATCIDDNGKLKWCINTGHGDAMHVSDFDPTNEGIEVFTCHEDSPYGVSLIDGDTGKQIFRINADGDTGRCCAGNVWSENPGAEYWFNTTTVDSKGNTLSCRRPSINFMSYWDGDLEREALDGSTDSPATIADMGKDGILRNILTTDGYYTCNTTKGTPCLSADIFGDWREELIVRKASGDAIGIFMTPYTTEYRITTLMHDPQYRTQVACQQVAYNQPPHPSFFLGTGYPLPARPNVKVNGEGAGPTGPVLKQGAVIDETHTYRFKNVNSGLYLEVAGAELANGANVQQGTTGGMDWTVKSVGDGYYRVYSALGDGTFHLLDLDYGKVENGTNIGIWTDTAADAQIFKFVDNGDGSYTIVTKSTQDQSAIGVAAASKDAGANVVQWACNDSADQKWILEIQVPTINGVLVQNLKVLDTTTYTKWKIDTDLAVGDLVAGDRTATFIALPDEVIGGELIQVACDAKFITTDLATFQAGENMTVYIAMDSRVTTMPSWLSDWTATGLSTQNSNEVSMNLYSKKVSKGDTIVLGSNGQSASCVNYVVMAVKESAVTTTTTTPEVTTTTTTTTMAAPTPVPFDVSCDGRINVFDLLLLKMYLRSDESIDVQAMANADTNGDGVLTVVDAVQLQKKLMGA